MLPLNSKAEKTTGEAEVIDRAGGSTSASTTTETKMFPRENTN